MWLVYYYAPPEDAGLEALLPIGVAGALLFAANLLEAVDDPLIGHWSDRTRTSRERRPAGGDHRGHALRRKSGGAVHVEGAYP